MKEKPSSLSDTHGPKLPNIPEAVLASESLKLHTLLSPFPIYSYA